MKSSKYILSIAFILFCINSSAQTDTTNDAWEDVSQTQTVTKNKVGIGVTNPTFELEVLGNSRLEGLLYVTKPGSSTGTIGLTSPTGLPGIIMRGNDPESYRGDIKLSNDGWRFATHSGTSIPPVRMSILNNGNVGIGLTNPEFPLVVNGVISNGGSDFVIGKHDSRPQGTKLKNRALVHGNGSDPLIINYDGDFEGGVQVQGQGLSVEGTTTVQYLYPNLDDGNPYRYIRFGKPNDYWAGFMMNTNSANYGDGGDFSIFTYGNRDMTFRTGTGNFIIFPSSGGNVGINTQNPGARFHLNTTGLGTNDVAFRMGGNSQFVIDAPNVIGGRVMVLDNGNVGIGTTTPDNKLDVNGVIRSKEILVETGWADHVFDDQYKVPTLVEEAQHIAEQGHLKGVPSAKELNGVIGLAEMTTIQQTKIEEVYLHLIDKDNTIQEQATEIQELQQMVLKLSQRLDQLEADK